MTISNTSRTAGPFIGNGITKNFPFSYKVFARSDVLVAMTVISTGVETLKTLDADYTVTLNPNQDSNPGGVITMAVAPPVGTTLAATSNIPLVQSLDLTNQGGFYPKVINDALDRMVINIQQLAGKIGQGLGIGQAAITDAALAALALVQQIGGAGGAGLIGFLQDGAGAVLRTILDRMFDTVSVKDFGAKGDGVTNDSAACTAAAKHALLKRRKLRWPKGTYYIPDGIQLSNDGAPQWPFLDWEGEASTTGNGLYQTLSTSGKVDGGAVLVTNGVNALSLNMDSFFNESISISNLGFVNKGARGLSCAILIDKNNTTYPRGWKFERLGYHNFDSCIAIRSNNADINTNYFGSLVVRENFAYDCGLGVQFINAYANLALVQGCLFHSCNKGGIAFNGASGGILTVRDSHFEGCEPAGIIAGAYTTVLNLDSASAELCGVVSGYGMVKRSASIGALRVNVSNVGYGDKGFSLMPTEFRLGRGDVINASCPVNASGYGWRTETPDMVTPVVSNNAAYNQAEKSTLCMVPLNSNIGRSGVRCFKQFGGWNSGGNISYVTPDSSDLPEALRSRFVGTKSSTGVPFFNVADTFVAPQAGYMYASWIASYSAADNGFVPGSSVVCAGENLTLGFTFGPHEGNFLLVMPMAANATLGRVSLTTYSAPKFSTPAYLTFETRLLSAGEAACGYPRITTMKDLLPSAYFVKLTDYGDAATPFTLRIRIWFNGGKLGYKEYLVTGDGTAAGRVYTTIADVPKAGIQMTLNAGLNAALYDIRIDNSTGADVTVTRQVEYLS